MKPVILSIVCAVMIAAASACAPNLAIRGNLPDPDKLAEIIPGEASRDDVAILLGSPSSAATFGDEIWYYIAARVETVAFNEPEVIDQQVIAIHFDDDGLVAAIDTYGLDDARTVEIVDRVTPTSGKEVTILQQLIGNVGRFARKEE